MRRLAVIVAVLLWVAAPAQAAVRTVDRGIVLRVRPHAIVLRELDGSKARIPVSASTVVTLDGQPATVASLQRGQVAFVLHFGRRPAVRIRAFSR